MDYKLLLDELDAKNIAYSKNELLSRHCSFKIGGPADIFVSIRSVEQIQFILSVCKDKYPVFIMGNGSNLLISDEGIRGVVIHIGSIFADIKSIDDNTVYCQAGVSLSTVCNYALMHELSGLEFAYGIPGSLGGAVYMNAGAYGGEMSQVVKSADYITLDGQKGTVCGEELDFSYRHSAFSDTDRIIVGATLSLKPADKDSIRSAMMENINKRKQKQPLELPSAGSVFKRPVGYYAGALIQDCGLMGFTVGGAQVSEKHAGFIVNIGDATANDVKKLVKHIKDTVYKKHGVMLETEIKGL